MGLHIEEKPDLESITACSQVPQTRGLSHSTVWGPIDLIKYVCDVVRSSVHYHQGNRAWKKDPEKAVHYFKKVTEHAPRENNRINMMLSKAYFKIGFNYHKNGETEEAMNNYREAIHWGKCLAASAKYGLAMIHHQQGNIKGALNRFHTAVLSRRRGGWHGSRFVFFDSEFYKEFPDQDYANQWYDKMITLSSKEGNRPQDLLRKALFHESTA